MSRKDAGTWVTGPQGTRWINTRHSKDALKEWLASGHVVCDEQGAPLEPPLPVTESAVAATAPPRPGDAHGLPVTTSPPPPPVGRHRR